MAVRALLPVGQEEKRVLPGEDDVIVTIAAPATMLIGGGAVGEIASVLARLGVRRPLLVTDPYMLSSGKIEAVAGPLGKANLPYAVFADTVPDPTVPVVEAGVRAFKAGNHDGLIALGGGSPIDTAKAIGLLVANGGRVRDWKVPAQAPIPSPPLVAVPTTAGTGSEVTRFTVITDPDTDEKMLIAGLGLVPSAALVDYELTLTCPKRLTADTGIDALTHAIEAYVSKKANPYSDSMALAAMGRIARWLETAVDQPDNRRAREEMMIGATQAGLAFSNASVALVHGMSRPIGAFFHVPHGLSNAMLLPHVTEFSLAAASSRYADCARAMGAASADASDDVAGRALLEALVQFNARLDVPTPKAYGIDEARWRQLRPLMAEQALASGSPGNNPVVPTIDQMVELYDRAFQ
jgi:alcohol dehydrogenase class IV